MDLNGAAGRWNHRVDDDYSSQPGKLFRPMSPAQQQVPFENIARDCNRYRYGSDLEFVIRSQLYY